MYPSAEAIGLAPALALAVAWFARGRRISRPRLALGALGVALVFAAFDTELQPLATHTFLWAHLLQNVVLAEWAPALLLLAVPRDLAARAGSFPLFRPLVALPLWVATYYVWHLPVIYDAALRRPHSLLHVEHFTYLLAGICLWWPVIHSRRSAGAKAAYLFAAFVLASPLGLLLALLPNAVYGFYEARPTVWGLSHLLDQEIAGTTMAGEQAIVFFAAFLFYFLRFLQEEERVQPLSSSARTPATPARQSSSTSSSGRS